MRMYEKWVKRSKIQIEFEIFHDCISNINKITNHPKLRSFQYRILNVAIVLNKHLVKWGLKPSGNCTFCGETKEELSHIFYECKVITKIWCKIKDLFKQIDNTAVFQLNAETVLLNTVHKKAMHVFNFIVLSVKCYIYSKKCTSQTILAQEVLLYILTSAVEWKNFMQKRIIEWKNITRNG